MRDTGIAKLFRNGRSQAVRLPREFRFEGTQVRVRRLAEGVLLEPLIADPAEWFAELDRVRAKSFLGRGRNQPVTPRREIFK
jgi:antitoxin VapB